MKCLVIANTAGGVGKSTTAHALAVAAVEYGKKTLLIDADPAATLTFYCGVENPRLTTQEFLTGEFSLEASTVKTSERFGFLPSSTRLTSMNIDQSIPADKFKASVAEYDLVIIDTASGPNQCTNYFLGVGDRVVIPTTQEISAIRGALHIKNFAESAGHSNQLELLFVRNTEELSTQMSEIVKSDFRILEPAIRENQLVSAAQISGKSVLTTSKASEVAADYREICYTILDELQLI